MNRNISEKFIDELYELSNSDYSDSVVLQAKRCLLDYLGVTLAGAQMLREKSNQLLDFFRDTEGNTSVIGLNRKVNIENAVFLNGINSHVAELDDGIRFGMIHPGAPIFSALLPVAENRGIQGGKLLLGIIIGYEAAIRLAYTIQPTHYNKGYHPTATCGTIGVAIGLAAMLGLSKKHMKDSLSASAVSATGTLKVIEDESELKPFNVGKASLNGFLSASMAMVGFKGPNDVLSDDTGFLSMMTGNGYVSKIKKIEYKDSLAINKVYFKPYAACRHAHPAIEATLKIRKNNNIDIQKIADIKVITYKGVIGKHDHNKIVGSSSAKMSIPCSVAVSLVYGKAGIEEFSGEHILDSRVISLTEKVTVYSAEEITKLVPKRRAAIVEITTDDGYCFTERVDFPKGEPENPLSNIEIEDKFRTLASYGGKNNKEIEKIIKSVWSLEEDLQNLLKLL